ncbi:MAG: NUDIX hydrolase, partial [Chloroflexi bacterium]|nr:NUDIX hydrolase [Chloroflexota bacterium]
MKAWTTLDSKTLIESEWLTVRQETCRLPDGSLLEGYFTWEGKDVAMVFACT